MNKIPAKLNKEVFSQIQKLISEERIVELTSKMININTTNPPGNEDKFVSMLKKELNLNGIENSEILEKEKGRANLVARIKGNKPGPIVAIVGHSDVVPTEGQIWSSDPFKAVVKDGKIIGRGAIDNKGPFAATIEAVRVFLDLNNSNFAGEILLIAAADEETGSTFGVRYLFEELGIKCDYALIPDGGEFSQLSYGEMGILWLNFTSKGKAYHGSMPENGFNAITPLAFTYSKLNEYDWSKFKGDEAFDAAVLNLGTFKGGNAPNIVPDFAEMSAMWRYPVGIKMEKVLEVVDEIISECQSKFPQSKIQYNINKSSIPFLANKSGVLIQGLLDAADEMGVAKPELKTIRAETVAKYIAQNSGAEVAVNGPMDGSLSIMHTADEYVEIEALVKFAQYYALTLYKLLCNEYVVTENQE